MLYVECGRCTPRMMRWITALIIKELKARAHRVFF